MEQTAETNRTDQIKRERGSGNRFLYTFSGCGPSVVGDPDCRDFGGIFELYRHLSYVPASVRVTDDFCGVGQRKQYGRLCKSFPDTEAGGDFKTVLDSQVLKKKVADTLDMDSFPGSVKVEIIPETNLLNVTVTADSPTEAFRLLETMLEQYPSVSQSVLGDVVLEVFEDPNDPSAPVESFQGRRVMKIGFLAGAGVMAVLFALLSFMRDSVKNEKEVRSKLDTTLFATIYHERKYQSLKAFVKRKKKKLWISEPSVSFGYEETIKKIRTKFLYERKKRGGRILVISSTSPQEGKTTVAINLALALAQDDKKVLLVEGDLRRSALRVGLGLQEADIKSWGRCSSVEDMEKAVYYMEETGFSVMVNDEKQQRSTEIVGSKTVKNFLEKMQEQMDVIIIDAPHIKGRSDAEMWAQNADMSLLVVKQNKTLAKYINDAIDVLDRQDNRLLGAAFLMMFPAEEASFHPAMAMVMDTVMAMDTDMEDMESTDVTGHITLMIIKRARKKKDKEHE